MSMSGHRSGALDAPQWCADAPLRWRVGGMRPQDGRFAALARLLLWWSRPHDEAESDVDILEPLRFLDPSAFALPLWAPRIAAGA